MPHVCRWWGGYFIDNLLRRLFHNPLKIVGPYVGPGTVMDVGCGIGFCSIAMAKLVGDSGLVIAIDLQQAWLTESDFTSAKQNRLEIDTQADFAPAFMMVHEAPDQRRLLGEIQTCLAPGGKLLVAEPKIHVSGKTFAQEATTTAEEVGF